MKESQTTKQAPIPTTAPTTAADWAAVLVKLAARRVELCEAKLAAEAEVAELQAATRSGNPGHQAGAMVAAKGPAAATGELAVERMKRLWRQVHDYTEGLRLIYKDETNAKSQHNRALIAESAAPLAETMTEVRRAAGSLALAVMAHEDARAQVQELVGPSEPVPLGLPMPPVAVVPAVKTKQVFDMSPILSWSI